MSAGMRVAAGAASFISAEPAMDTELVREHFSRHLETARLAADVLPESIERCRQCLTAALRAGGKILVMGNGGSAADAQHFAAELVGRFLRERRALAAIALTTDTSILTALGNDYGFDAIFARQVEALARPGDVVMAISTSGNSANLIQALDRARAMGCTTVGLLGRDGGRAVTAVDLALIVPSAETPRIQEMHALIVHILCDLVERDLADA